MIIWLMLMLGFSVIMVQYFGFLIEEDWLLRRGLRRKLGTDKTFNAIDDCILESAWDIASRAGIIFVVKFVKVQSLDRQFWCLALGSTDPRDGLPPTPSQEHIDKLRDLLMKKPHIKPRWYAHVV